MCTNNDSVIACFEVIVAQGHQPTKRNKILSQHNIQNELDTFLY